jgi:hypothetical protein
MSQRTDDLGEIGGLSNPSKMPCEGYSTTAKRGCPLGALLAAIPGSTCEECYADDGRYVMPNVRAATDRRLTRVQEATADAASGDRWVEALVRILRGKLASTLARLERGQTIGQDGRYFRWHDAGDLHNLAHLKLIARVAFLTPDVTHWLPTREVGTVAEYLKRGGVLPANLRVRLSVPMREQTPSGLLATLAAAPGIGWSGVSEREDAMGAELCDAEERGGECGPCRRCWDVEGSPGIVYRKI